MATGAVARSRRSRVRDGEVNSAATVASVSGSVWCQTKRRSDGPSPSSKKSSSASARSVDLVRFWVQLRVNTRLQFRKAGRFCGL